MSLFGWRNGELGGQEKLAEEFEKTDPGKDVAGTRFLDGYCVSRKLLVYDLERFFAGNIFKPKRLGGSFLFGPDICAGLRSDYDTRGSVPVKTLLVLAAGLGLLVVLLTTILVAYFRGRSLPSGSLMAVGYNIGIVTSWFANATWPVVMVLTVLLAQKWNRKTRKPA